MQVQVVEDEMHVPQGADVGTVKSTYRRTPVLQHIMIAIGAGGTCCIFRYYCSCCTLQLYRTIAVTIKTGQFVLIVKFSSTKTPQTIMSQQHLTSTQTYLQLVDVSIMRLHVFKNKLCCSCIFHLNESVRSCITIPFGRYYR